MQIISPIAAAVVMVVGAILAIRLSGDYGVLVFCGLPALGSYLAVALLRLDGPKQVWPCLGTASLAYLLAGGILLVVGWEGLICLVLAMPIGIPFVLVGALLAHALHHRERPPVPPGAPVLLLAAIAAADIAASGSDDIRTVESNLEVRASAESVWSAIVNLGDVGPTDDWVFRTGIATPVRCELYGEGVGARRVCTVSTGKIPEIVTDWQPGRALAFRALSTPPPMKEMNPFWDVHPEHLEGAYEVIDGAFTIREIDSGRCMVSRNTRFRSRIRPFAYWSGLCEFAADRGHLVVLKKVKALAESASPGRLAMK